MEADPLTRAEFATVASIAVLERDTGEQVRNPKLTARATTFRQHPYTMVVPGRLVFWGGVWTD